MRNMLSQIESEGHQYQIFTEATYLKKDDITIIKVNGFVKYINGNLHRKNTTSENSKWYVRTAQLVGFPQKELKLFNPVELAEYAVVNGIRGEPAFICWVR